VEIVLPEGKVMWQESSASLVSGGGVAGIVEGVTR
jgi:hypothetical protein